VTWDVWAPLSDLVSLEEIEVMKSLSYLFASACYRDGGLQTDFFIPPNGETPHVVGWKEEPLYIIAHGMGCVKTKIAEGVIWWDG
jgi:hypothetical protein